MSYQAFELLNVEIDRGVAFVTIDHPPINLFDQQLILEMFRVGPQLAEDDEVRVVVFQSANPEFFIAHADITLIQTLSPDAHREDDSNLFHVMVEQFRTMPKVTICKLEGIARGGGSEFALSLDMRFGAMGQAVLAQPEVAIGIIPGGSGTQRLPRLIGRSRALEVIMGCEDFPAELAERYGYINRAMPADELTPFVADLAYRIASFPPEAVAAAKLSVDAAELNLDAGLRIESEQFNGCLATDAAQRRMDRFMELGGQTREVELNLRGLLDKLAN